MKHFNKTLTSVGRRTLLRRVIEIGQESLNLIHVVNVSKVAEVLSLTAHGLGPRWLAHSRICQ